MSSLSHIPYVPERIFSVFLLQSSGISPPNHSPSLTFQSCFHNQALLHSHSSLLPCTFHCQYHSSALTYLMRCSKTALIRSSQCSNTVPQLNSCVNLGNYLTFLCFNSLYLCKGVNNSIYFIWLLWELNELTYIKNSIQCLTCSKPYISLNVSNYFLCLLSLFSSAYLQLTD